MSSPEGVSPEVAPIGARPGAAGPVQPRSAREVLIWGILVTVILALVAAAVLQRLRDARPAPLPVITQLPAFELQNRDGSHVRLADLAGSVWVADFIFTRCPGICPFMTKQMSRVVQEMPDGVRAVSFSVDPDYDTPEVLQEYAARHDAPDHWYFLTGTREEIHALSKDGFLLAVADVQESEGQGPEVQGSETLDQADSIEPIVHSNRFVLVDEAGRIRGYYDAFDETDVQRLLSDLQRLAR